MSVSNKSAMGDLKASQKVVGIDLGLGRFESDLSLGQFERSSLELRDSNY